MFSALFLFPLASFSEQNSDASFQNGEVSSQDGDVSSQNGEVSSDSKSRRHAAALVPLQSADGAITLTELKGKVVIIFFGYTHCPDVCPRDLEIVAKALKGLSEPQLKSTQGLFVSLDPSRDDVKSLQQFTRYFHKDMLGVTASEAVIRQFSSSFGIQYKKVPVTGSASGYSIEHTTSFYVLDVQGQLSFILPNGISPLALQQAVQFLLSENPQDL